MSDVSAIRLLDSFSAVFQLFLICQLDLSFFSPLLCAAELGPPARPDRQAPIRVTRLH